MEAIKDAVLSTLKINVNYSLITLEDLEHPRLKQYYAIYWDVTLFFTTFFFIIMLYTIIKKSSKEMGEYKWYLCHQLCWSYFFDVFMSIWKPIPLWPFYLGYSGGFLSGIPNKFSIIPLVSLTFVSVGMAFGIGGSLVHRCVQVSPLSSYFKIYDKLGVRLITNFILFVSTQCLLCIPLAYNTVDIEILRPSLERQNSALKIFFSRESSIFGYDPSLNGNMSALFMGLCILALLFCLILLTILYLNFVRILLRNKSLLSVATYNLQKILFKALYIQIFLAGILLIFPVVISCILTIYGIRWVSTFSIFALMITATHAMADFAVLIYYVKPYRVFILGLFKKALTKIGFKFQTATVHALIVSTSGNTSSNVSPAILVP